MPKNDSYIESSNRKKHSRHRARQSESESESDPNEFYVPPTETVPEPVKEELPKPTGSKIYDYVIKNKYMIIAIIIVLILMVIAAWYFMREDKKPTKNIEDNPVGEPDKMPKIVRPPIPTQFQPMPPQPPPPPQRPMVKPAPPVAKPDMTHEEIVNTVDDDELNKYINLDAKKTLPPKPLPQPVAKSMIVPSEPKKEVKEIKEVEEKEQKTAPVSELPDSFLDDDEYDLSE